MNLNTPVDIVLFIIEIIGCISFATSGAFTAIRKRADILGVLLLSLIEIFGGGLLRDLIINQGAPHIFWDVHYLVLAAISIVIAIFWFVIASIKKTAPFIDKHRHDTWIYTLDALGIAVFCCYGVEAAYAALPDGIGTVGIYIYCTCLGVITGVGGGMFRDVFVGEIPMVFKKHFYMTPCIVGSLIYALMYINGVNQVVSLCVCILIIVLLRTLATIFKWNLPRAKAYNEIRDAQEAMEKENNNEVKQNESSNH